MNRRQLLLGAAGLAPSLSTIPVTPVATSIVRVNARPIALRNFYTMLPPIEAWPLRASLAPRLPSPGE